MSSLKRGLGRGLDALLATSAKAQIHEEEIQSNLHSPLRQIPITQLIAGNYQPRQEMEQDSLEELADSIRAQGIIQPIVVRHLPNDKYEIIAGERRFRAAKIADLTQVPCLVRVLDDRAAGTIALIENIQREDLNAMEEAQALERLINDFSLTHQQIAQALGKSRATITNLLRLNSLEPSVKKMLQTHQLEMGHGRAILALDNAKQIEAAEIIIEKQYTVRQAEALVKNMLSSKPATAIQSPDEWQALQNKLSSKLGAKVTVNQNAQGKVKLVLSCDKTKFEQIIKRLENDETDNY